MYQEDTLKKKQWCILVSEGKYTVRFSKSRNGLTHTIHKALFDYFYVTWIGKIYMNGFNLFGI
jgi:hypothetical protein